jgi:pimeloyl-ACP methyl ester carboxylesterase
MDAFAIGALLITLTLCPVAAAAGQRVDFVVGQGAQTIASERVTRSSVQLSGELKSPQARITYSAQVDAAGLVPKLEFAIYAGSATTATAQGTVTFAGDSAFANVQAPGVPAVQKFAPGAGALPYINLSSGLLEQIVLRARSLGGEQVTLPLLSVESGQLFSATVKGATTDSVVVVLPPQVELHLKLDAAGRLLRGSVPSQGVTIERGDATGAMPGPAPAAAAAPDYSAPAGAPYTAEEVRVPTPGGYALAGTLTLPRPPAGAVPAVVLISGSGLQDRDSAIPGVTGYRPFRQIADALSRRGIAVLRLDDRGFGASGGDPSQATSADFAADVRAALDFLRTRAGIDQRRLALVGHSEGGMIAPMVAVEDSSLRAVVLMAGPAWTGRRTSDYQLREAWKGMGLNEAQMDTMRAKNDPLRDQAAATVPWVRFWMDYDPLPTAKRLSVPALILQGATDRQIPAEQATELANAIRSGGDLDVSVRVFPGLNHLFLPDPVGTAGIGEYAELPSKEIPVEVLTTLAEWLESHLE